MTTSTIDQADSKIDSLYAQIDDWGTEYEMGEVSYQIYQERVNELQHQIDLLMSEIAIHEGAMEVIEEPMEDTVALPLEVINELAELDAKIAILEDRIKEINEEFAASQAMDHMWLAVEVTRINTEMDALIDRVMILEGQGA